MEYPKVAVIDYGMGNIWSVQSALNYLGVEASTVGDPEILERVEYLVLPGVGSFRKAMEALRAREIDEAIYSAVLKKNAKILGICLGMQLLGAHGTEDGETAGLGLVENKVNKFTADELGQKKIPHVGFDAVHIEGRDGLFKGLPKAADFYFTHSYRMLIENGKGRYATCSYGVEFLAAFEVGNIYGAQFHPEKSQTNGLILLANYLRS
jgi:imidazole glycerol-phosphate synthase subunit HisH